MRIDNRPKKTNKKPIIIMLVIIVFVSLSAGGYLYWQRPAKQKPAEKDDYIQKIDLNPSTEEQKKAGADIKKSVNTETVSKNFTVTITSANATGELIQIRALINGAVTNDGDCVLTLSQSGNNITKSVKTSALPSSSTCQGFEINRSELSSGTWSIGLVVKIGSEIANTKSEVVIE